MKKFIVNVFRAPDREWVIHKKEFIDADLANDYAEKVYLKYYKEHPGRYDVEVVEVEASAKDEKRGK